MRPIRVTITVLSLAAALVCLASPPGGARPVDLFSAASDGDISSVRDIIAGSPDSLDARGESDATALHMAAYRGHIDIARLLVGLGARLDLRSTYGQTPLSYAVMTDQKEIVKFLLDSGASPDIGDNWGNTPLAYAVMRKYSDIIIMLLDAGADPELSNEREETPFWRSAWAGDLATARLLLGHGAGMDAPDIWGRTPLAAAALRGNSESVEFLLAEGADPGIADLGGRLPVHYAAATGRTDVITALMGRDTPVDLPDKDGRTPAGLAAMRGHISVLEMLLGAGAMDPGVDPAGPFDFGPDPVREGAARIWYLGHSGWAVQTGSHLLIFDYYQDGALPGRPLLANGYIDPAEIRDLDVIVFASHGHPDHFDEAILGWQPGLSRVSYVFGWPADVDSCHVRLGPKKSVDLDGVRIECVHSPEAGEIDGNFLVRVDGLVIYHAGDYTRGHETFTKDMEYLARTAPDIDLFFMQAGNEMDDGEAMLALEKVRPRWMFPMHSGGREYSLELFGRKFARTGLPTRLALPRDRGDAFFYSDGEVSSGTQSGAPAE